MHEDAEPIAVRASSTMLLKRTFWTPSAECDRVESVPAGETRRQSGSGAPEALVEPAAISERSVPLGLPQHRGDQW